MNSKLIREKKRAVRIRKKIVAVSSRPRLTVFRSNKYFYAQIIDDKKGITLVTANDTVWDKKLAAGKIARAEEVGKMLADKAKEKKITKVVFDKGAYKYHGRVKAFAESARQSGLVF